MKSIKLYLPLVLMILLFACAKDCKSESKAAGNQALSAPAAVDEQGVQFESANDKEEDLVANNIQKQFISSSAAVENGKDSGRKFIRTADLRFKVDNVLKATYSIENIAQQFGGFITFTNLNSNIDSKTTVAVSQDSSLESTYYTVNNHLILRVPNTQLDTTLKSIAVLINYLDHRIIKAEDVSLLLLSNKMEQDRIKNSERRLTKAIDDRGRKLRETTEAEDQLLQMQEQSDRAKLANLTLEDKIAFSTVDVSIYQRQSVYREVISNEKNIDAFKPGTGSRIINALKSGWIILDSILIFVIQLWSLILIAIVVYIVYKIIRRNHG